MTPPRITPELEAAIRSEAAPMGIEYDAALRLYDLDHAFRERCDEYADAMSQDPSYDWANLISFDHWENDKASSDAATKLAIEEGSAFSDIQKAAAAMGRKGGLTGGKSKSLKKRASAQRNIARARAVKAENRIRKGTK